MRDWVLGGGYFGNPAAAGPPTIRPLPPPPVGVGLGGVWVGAEDTRSFCFGLFGIQLSPPPPPPSWGWDIFGCGFPKICGGWLPQFTPPKPPPPPLCGRAKPCRCNGEQWDKHSTALLRDPKWLRNPRALRVSKANRLKVAKYPLLHRASNRATSDHYGPWHSHDSAVCGTSRHEYHISGHAPQRTDPDTHETLTHAPPETLTKGATSAKCIHLQPPLPPVQDSRSAAGPGLLFQRAEGRTDPSTNTNPDTHQPRHAPTPNTEQGLTEAVCVRVSVCRDLVYVRVNVRIKVTVYHSQCLSGRGGD